jgi:hypothetical protein
VFSRGGDASQRLYYYVAELQRRGKLAGPSPEIFDIAFVPRDSSLEHTEAAIAALMRRLDVSARMLLDGIESANQLRHRYADLQRQRTADGALFERLARALLWSDPTHWLDEFAAPAAVAGTGRCLLAGSMPPDERLHRTIDATGMSVIAEAHALAPGQLGTELDLKGAPLEQALARHLRRTSTGPRAFFDRAAAVVERARTVRADAVVLWLTREDEALAWSAPALQHALADAGLPMLLLPAARWQADDGALEMITEFCGEYVRASA